MFPSLFLSQMTAVEEGSAALSFSAGSHGSLGWGVSSPDVTLVLVLLTEFAARCLRLVSWGLFPQQGQWAVITSIPYLTCALSYCHCCDLTLLYPSQRLEGRHSLERLWSGQCGEPERGEGCCEVGSGLVKAAKKPRAAETRSRRRREGIVSEP